VDRETTIARKHVQDVERAIIQEQEDMRNVEKAQSTTTKREPTFHVMLNALGDSLSDLPSSEDREQGEDEGVEKTDTALAKLSEVDEPGWVMSTISKTVRHGREGFQPKRMRLDELTQPGWDHAANYFHERDMRYGTSELKVPAVVKPQTVTIAATPSPTTL